MKKPNTKKNFMSEKTKSKIRSNKQKRSDGKGYTKDEIGEKGNDLAWHSKSQQLLFDNASIPWSWATGKSIRRHMNYDLQATAEVRDQEYYLPGICSIRTVHTPGVANNGADAINQAAMSLYTDIRRMLKSANVYEASDVIIYMMAVAEILAYISWATRIYGTLMLYSYTNTYVPTALLHAQGVNAEELKAHPAEFRGRINVLIAKASQIWIPKGFDFLERMKFIYANYYTEGPSMKDQLYMWTPALFRRFELDEEGDYKGQLVPKFIIPRASDNIENLWNMDQICKTLESMIDALIGDSDFQNIAGDLFNRYGAGGVETYQLIPENVIVQPVISIEVLEQMQNARCLNIVHNLYNTFFTANANIKTNPTAFWTISQDETRNILIIPNTINMGIDDYALLVNAKYGALDPILVIHDNPSPEKTMLISRQTNLIFHGEEDLTEGATFWFDVACEWVVEIDYVYKSSDQIAGAEYAVTTEIGSESNNSGDMERFLTVISVMSSFHYHPLMFLVRRSTTIPTLGHYAFGEQDIVAPISAASLKEINRVDLLSLFAVPDVGKVTG